MQTRRYPFAPVVAVLLQILAVLILVTVLYSSFQEIGQLKSAWSTISQTDRIPTILKVIGSLLSSLLTPLVFWLIADLVLAAREIEYNTRVMAGIEEPEHVEEAAFPGPAPAPAPEQTPPPGEAPAA